ncbi:MAG: hypothetical protein AB201_01905 [Parcubacteria bacterium C7867-006]|nr:MAG: hypothetical protein AB201_01905 [Parcubacteria bacterium C7867-006]
MNSPGHKANIMNENFTEIGIATADGMYQGKMTTFVVQLFGRPAEPETIVSAPKTTTKKVTEKPIVSAASSAVLSESVSTEVLGENGTNELYVSAKKNSLATTVSPKVKYSNFFERALFSPEKSLSILYSLIALLVTIGLAFTVFIEFRAHNLRMVFLAIGLLTVIFGLLYVYKSIIVDPLIIA